MGYGTTVMIIIVMVNVMVYLGALAIDNSLINSSAVQLLIDSKQGGGQVLANLLPTTFDFVSDNLLPLGILVALMFTLSTATGSVGVGSTGGSGVGVQLLPMMIGAFLFISFALSPSFDAMGFPAPLDDVIFLIFGILQVIGIYGVIRGE